MCCNLRCATIRCKNQYKLRYRRHEKTVSFVRMSVILKYEMNWWKYESGLDKCLPYSNGNLSVWKPIDNNSIKGFKKGKVIFFKWIFLKFYAQSGQQTSCTCSNKITFNGNSNKRWRQTTTQSQSQWIPYIQNNNRNNHHTLHAQFLLFYSRLATTLLASTLPFDWAH